MGHRNRRILITLFAMMSMMPVMAAAQQAFPTKPMRIILPFAPVGGPDLATRRTASELQARLGQPVVVDNRPGGNFVIGADACRRAAPDGYTLCYVTSNQFSINPYVLRELPYDPEKDFRPVTNLFTLVAGIFVSAKHPANTLLELERYARANPGKINYPTHGPNSGTDIQRRWLNEKWRTDMVGIGYKGGPEMLTALVGGVVQVAVIGVTSALPQVNAKAVKILAVSSQARYPSFPDVPTFAESGITDWPLVPWQGLSYQAAVPEAIVRRINAEVVRLYKEPEFGKFLVSQGFEVMVGTPEEFAAYARKDRAVTAELIRKFNIPRE